MEHKLGVKSGSSRSARDPRCSGCGKSEKQAALLISNPDGTAFICGECVACCHAVLEDHLAGIGSPPDERKQLALQVYNHCNPYLRDRLKDGAAPRGLNLFIAGPSGPARLLILRAVAWMLRLRAGRIRLPDPLYLMLRPEREATG